MSNYRKKKRSSADGEKRQCVLYLRVSTASQTYTARDISKDGNSIAVQREETMAKANELGLVVAKEFVEPGRSAQTMEKRPVFRQMLAYVSEHPEVGAIIVYSRSRAFRNVEDAMLTRRNLRMLGVKLISTKEDFGDSFEGDAMATITDAMNELQYRLNGQDVKLKMAHKAKNGGTITRAPIGYLNTRITVEGHLVNSIGIDEERAPLVRLMFELYATGEYSIPQLTAVMQDQGLEARPTGRHLTPRPITRDTIERVLGDPYYAGWIFYDGELYEGRHEALIDQELFDRVQDLLEARSGTGMHMQVPSLPEGVLVVRTLRGRWASEPPHLHGGQGWSICLFRVHGPLRARLRSPVPPRRSRRGRSRAALLRVAVGRGLRREAPRRAGGWHGGSPADPAGPRGQPHTGAVESGRAG